VRYFALGTNEWCEKDEWPTEAPVTLYLHSLGGANSRMGDGCLTANSPTEEERRDVFVYDPEVPVLAPGGPQALSGAFDQRTMEMGNHLLVYTTAVVRETAHLCGQPRVTLYAVTSAAEADLTAKLVWVTAAYRAEFLCMGIARSSWLFRDGTYAADTIHGWEFTLEATSVVLSPGDRLRLEVASSAFPLYDRNPSTGVSPEAANAWSWGRSTQQILHTAEYPSALHLPMRGGSPW